jgi:hypothetical protein
MKYNLAYTRMVTDSDASIEAALREAEIYAAKSTKTSITSIAACTLAWTTFWVMSKMFVGELLELLFWSYESFS